MICQPAIKVFNTIQTAPLLNEGKPAAAEGRIALPVANHDEDATQGDRAR